MVNFTCNKCGDSLKKKDVSTHFQRKPNCRQAVSLTCFDCLKEFNQNYTSHTICVTEDQRYSANGLKGVEKTKQQLWSETVHQHLRSVLQTQCSSLTNSVKALIEYALSNPSIPKKEKAFFNFVRNARKFPENDARTVWGFLSEIRMQENGDKTNGTAKDSKQTPVSSNGTPSTNNKAASPQKTKKKEKSEPAEESSNVNVAEDKDNIKEGKKKKKSKKALGEGIEGKEELNDSGIVPEELNESKDSKKHKRKREKSESADALQANGNSEEAMEVEQQICEVNEDAEKLSKKEKKLKKKKEKYEAEIRALETANANLEEQEEVEGEAIPEEGKKKKSKKLQNENAETEDDESKNKKKRQRTVSMVAETDQPKKKNKSKINDENAEPNEEEQEVPSGKKEFKWGDVIIQVLQSQDDKEMSVKRLCKKVVNEYLSSLLEDTHVDEVKATVKFQKKLQKTPGVFVHKDKARLKTSE